MPKFSKKSLQHLSSCCMELQLIAHTGIRIFDFCVIEGYRNEEDQNRYYEAGTSKLKFPHGKHNRTPSDAVDLWPYDRGLKMAFSGNHEQCERMASLLGISVEGAQAYVREQFCMMAGVIITSALLVGYGNQIIWGGDWDRDGSRYDQVFHDLGHFEIMRY